MVNRTLVAGLVAGVAVAALFAPLEASARGGGFGAGRAIGFHGGFRPLPARRFVAPRPPLRQVVTPRRLAHARVARFGPFRHHGRDLGNGAGVSGVGGYYGSSSDPSYGYGQPADAGAAQPALVGDGAQLHRRTCYSDVQRVPSERGGMSDVTVTRCYPVNE